MPVNAEKNDPISFPYQASVEAALELDEEGHPLNLSATGGSGSSLPYPTRRSISNLGNFAMNAPEQLGGSLKSGATSVTTLGVSAVVGGATNLVGAPGKMVRSGSMLKDVTGEKLGALQDTFLEKEKWEDVEEWEDLDETLTMFGGTDEINRQKNRRLTMLEAQAKRSVRGSIVIPAPKRALAKRKIDRRGGADLRGWQVRVGQSNKPAARRKYLQCVSISHFPRVPDHVL